jgi:hypothetical protein
MRNTVCRQYKFQLVKSRRLDDTCLTEWQCIWDSYTFPTSMTSSAGSLDGLLIYPPKKSIIKTVHAYWLIGSVMSLLGKSNTTPVAIMSSQSSDHTVFWKSITNLPNKRGMCCIPILQLFSQRLHLHTFSHEFDNEWKLTPAKVYTNHMLFTKVLDWECASAHFWKRLEN